MKISSDVAIISQVKIGMRHIVMPGARYRRTVDDEVDRGKNRRDARHQQTDQPQILAGSRRDCDFRKRRVGVHPDDAAPPAARAQQYDQTAENEHPESGRVQPRKCHIGRADLQRNQEVARVRFRTARRTRRSCGAVEREQLVVLVRRDQRQAGLGELRADDQRQNSSDAEEGKRPDEIHDADLLVIGRGEPIDHDGARPPAATQSR